MAASGGFKTVGLRAGRHHPGGCSCKDRIGPQEQPWSPPECPQKGENRVETWRGGGKKALKRKLLVARKTSLAPC